MRSVNQSPYTRAHTTIRIILSEPILILRRDAAVVLLPPALWAPWDKCNLLPILHVFNETTMPPDLYCDNHVRKGTFLIVRCERVIPWYLRSDAVNPSSAVPLRLRWNAWDSTTTFIQPALLICLGNVFFFSKDVYSSGTWTALCLSNELRSLRLKWQKCNQSYLVRRHWEDCLATHDGRTITWFFKVNLARIWTSVVIYTNRGVH